MDSNKNSEYLGIHSYLKNLYSLRENELLEYIKIVKLKEENLQTISDKFYDFILSTSHLLERSGKLFFDSIGETKSGNFMDKKGKFRTNMRNEIKLKDRAIFTLKDVIVPTIKISYFDDETLKIKPFEGLEPKAMKWWHLQNKFKHGFKENEEKIDIIKESNFENCLKCLSSSYVMLNFFSSINYYFNSVKPIKKEEIKKDFFDKFSSSPYPHTSYKKDKQGEWCVSHPSGYKWFPRTLKENDHMIHDVMSEIFQGFYWEPTTPFVYVNPKKS